MAITRAVIAAVALAPLAGAFTAPSLRSSVAPGAVEGLQTAPLASASVKAAAEPASNSGALLAGAVAAAAMLVGASKRRSELVARQGWTREPAYPGMEQEGDPSRGPTFRTWTNLKRRASKVIGRQRFFRQQKFLAEAGITAAKGGYHKWYPNREEHNLYKGPESHPENPDFPAASPGYQALRGWAPAKFGDSKKAGGSVFVAGKAPTIGSAKRAVYSSRAASSALVLRAHKKAASSTRNQGHKNNPKYWGVTKAGLQGNSVKTGQLLVNQKGYNWYPGANVVKCGDFSLRALKDGIVQWRGNYKHREVSVVPWEYVRTKCTWINPNTLGPKVYEPWMGTRTTGKRHHILKLRKEWLETDEGKAWVQKKEEKAAKQKEIQQKIRAYKKLRKAGKVSERKPAEVEATLSESESEAE